MSFEYAGSSQDENSLFANLTSHDFLEKVELAESIGELRVLQVLIVSHALDNEDDELAQNVAILVDQKIDAILQRELEEMVEIGKLELDFGN